MPDGRRGVSGVVFTDRGQSCPAGALSLVEQLDGAERTANLLGFAVRELGFVHLRPAAHGVIVTFRPAAASHLAVITLAYELFRRQPERVGLVILEQRPEVEIYRGLQGAVRRVEWLMEMARNPVARPSFGAKPIPIARLDRFGGALLPLYRAWSESAGEWTPGLHDRLRRARLLERAMIVRNPGQSEDLVVEHRGGAFAHYGRRWSRVARGRHIEDQPDRNYGQWVASGYRDALARFDPKLETVEATISTRSRAETRRSRYHRLVLPWRSAAGDRVVTSVSVLERTAIVE